MDDAKKPEVFEIHITGDESIHEVAATLCLKTIRVELLRPDGTILRTEHMTSHVARFGDWWACEKHVKLIVGCMRQSGVEVYRVKVETPFYPHYESMSKYVESHFVATDWSCPVSRNAKKTTLLGTMREWKHEKFASFRDDQKGRDLELCIYDDNPGQDADWMDCYQVNAA